MWDVCHVIMHNEILIIHLTFPYWNPKNPPREMQTILKYETQVFGDLVCQKTKISIFCKRQKISAFEFSQLCKAYSILLMVF